MEAVEDHKEGKDPHGIIYECLKDMYADKNVVRQLWKFEGVSLLLSLFSF